MLEDRILAIAEQHRAQAVDEKRAAFSALPADHQTFARLVAQIFGRPAAVSIRFADGRRYDQGVFMTAQAFPDFDKRLAAELPCKL